jgi:hypothetical protein
MSKRLVKFNKDEKLNAWHVHLVLPTDEDRPYTNDKKYRWRFSEDSGIDLAIDTLRTQYNLNARKVKAHHENEIASDNNYYVDRYNIRIRFKDEADEAAFIMLSITNGITLEDNGDSSLFV